MKNWKAQAAKRIVAEDALRQALRVIEEARQTGGPTSAQGYHYQLAMYLARHAAEQLRLSEEP